MMGTSSNPALSNLLLYGLDTMMPMQSASSWPGFIAFGTTIRLDLAERPSASQKVVLILGGKSMSNFNKMKNRDQKIKAR